MSAEIRTPRRPRASWIVAINVAVFVLMLLAVELAARGLSYLLRGSGTAGLPERTLYLNLRAVRHVRARLGSAARRRSAPPATRSSLLVGGSTAQGFAPEILAAAIAHARRPNRPRRQRRVRRLRSAPGGGGRVAVGADDRAGRRSCRSTDRTISSIGSASTAPGAFSWTRLSHIPDAPGDCAAGVAARAFAGLQRSGPLVGAPPHRRLDRNTRTRFRSTWTPNTR